MPTAAVVGISHFNPTPVRGDGALGSGPGGRGPSTCRATDHGADPAEGPPVGGASGEDGPRCVRTSCRTSTWPLRRRLLRPPLRCPCCCRGAALRSTVLAAGSRDRAMVLPGDTHPAQRGRGKLVTAVSRHTRRLFRSGSRNAPEAVKVLPNTVGEHLQPTPEPAGLVARYGPSGNIVLLTVSRLAAAERYKKLDKVIGALARLLPAHPDAGCRHRG